MERNIHTNFDVAVHWCGNHYILCNNLTSIDNEIWERVCEFLREGDEVFQWFISDCSEWDVEFLHEHFGLEFVYSEALDLYVLPVCHFGTQWSGVYWKTDLPQAEAEY